MFSLSTNVIILLLGALASMNACVHGKDSITKEIFRQHYKSYEKYVFHQRAQVALGRRTRLLAVGARLLGYDDFSIKCIPFSFPLLERNKKDIKQILNNVESDDCIQLVNILLDRCSQKPGDLNWVLRVTYEEGKRLEQEKFNKSGQVVSMQERVTFVAIGFFAQYWVENKLPF